MNPNLLSILWPMIETSEALRHPTFDIIKITEMSVNAAGTDKLKRDNCMSLIWDLVHCTMFCLTAVDQGQRLENHNYDGELNNMPMLFKR